jgi:hypothetical protein
MFSWPVDFSTRRRAAFDLHPYCAGLAHLGIGMNKLFTLSEEWLEHRPKEMTVIGEIAWRLPGGGIEASP